MWVKDNLFVIAYKDFTFDLVDMDQVEKYQKGIEEAERSGEDTNMKDEEAKEGE